MKRICLILTTILTISSCYSFAENTAYIDKKNNFSIDYPSNYRILKNYDKAALIILFPKKDFSFYNDNITVVAAKAGVSSDRTPEELLDIYFKYSKSVLKREKVMINGINFLCVTQTQKMLFLNLKQYHQIAVKGLKIYTITYTAVINNYDNSIDAAKRIMNTFKFID